jgi:hypothetical protein
MASKPMSWAMAALLFASMVAGTIGLTLAFTGVMRHQAASIHSDFWRIVVPSDLVANAILSVAMRWAYNRLAACRCQIGLQSRQSS